MRSEVNWSVSRDFKCKVKRPRVNWYEVLQSIDNISIRDYVYSQYLRLLKGRPFKRRMSQNRCAYLALTMQFSTSTLDRVRWLGERL